MQRMLTLPSRELKSDGMAKCTVYTAGHPRGVQTRLRWDGTELENIAPKNAPQQRADVLASFGLVADSLRFLPSRAEAHERE